MTLIKESSNSSNLDATLSRIKGKKGVIGVIILGSDVTSPLISTFDKKTTKFYTEYIRDLIKSANLFGERNKNDVQLIRLHFKNQIILVAPDKNFIFLVIQETNK